MALYENIRSKLARQELELDVDSRNFKHYSAKVKYLPENIEKADFFNLCCGTLKPGDTIVIRTKVDKTNKEESYDVMYTFLILYANPDEQKVTALQLKKVDMLNPEMNIEIDGVDTDALNSAINTIVEAKMAEITKAVTDLKEQFTTYTTETDNQLEEIELAIQELQPVIGETEAVNEVAETPMKIK